jgi:hypothetical protein
VTRRRPHRRRQPRLPCTERAAQLSRLGPEQWYDDHIVTADGCLCYPNQPDRTCDVGEALFRLQPRHMGPQAG